jgi:3-methylcrotonyl-CoA carboxylase alpha subunit
MFDSLLIANRGEIACRVIRTAKRMGLRTVAVYSDADASAQHVEMADAAYRLGPAPAAESYLKAEAVLEAAKLSGAQAIHPGYGFLSENAAFAEACAKASIVFVGPPVDAIRAMGSKSEAKAIMDKAGVPLVPGYHGENQDAAQLAEEAERIGYPVLIKASAGGGGKGMRRVDRPGDFADALEGAQRESQAAFGDSRVLIEKYLTKPRHIEMQVFADTKGNAVHLFERDCSIQRRHQKVIEEAPAPGMTEEKRAEMGQAAVDAAKAIGYVGAGTVEFISEGDDFFFMEMNTRLQVEHPVTEMITGLDLVEWQLRVAAGEALPKAQEELSIRGHAIEARVYAEDPERDFLPAVGRIAHLRPPEEEDGRVRVDSGVRGGDEVSVHYDPMIAKLIAWGEDREGARLELHRALEAYEVVGPTTNLGFLIRLTGHPAFTAAELDTGFIPRHEESLFPEAEEPDATILALAGLAELLRGESAARARAAVSNDPFSPFHHTDGWRLNMETRRELCFRRAGREIPMTIHYRASGYEIEVEGQRLKVAGRFEDAATLFVDIDGWRSHVRAVWQGPEVSLLLPGRQYGFHLVEPLSDLDEGDEASGSMTAPMPGKVIRVRAAEGDRVSQGAALMVLEAMKMEHTIAAPADGKVTAIHFGEGDLVEEGATLLEFEAEEAGDDAA